MRMMGADSVAYHQATIIDRADDHAGRALDYYGTRGETPLVWGGAGAVRLGLEGPVDRDEYGLAFGPGGFRDPVTRHQPVSTTRPGMELVVAAHKSVAVLGVLGRADDMHAILDAETTATLDYLDTWFRARGGRRGREQLRPETGGLLYATTRHGTSRAGDPAVHDHVLVANVVEMRDVKGGWKALDTASLRDVLHAATVVGRAAAAQEAVARGYGIVRDDGPSGRLRHWRIAGIPDEVLELYSKRSAEIDDFVDERGVDSYRARHTAARTTRSSKSEESPDELLPRWRAELEGIGWTVERLTNQIDHAHLTRASQVRRDAADLAAEVLGPESTLAARKVFSRRDLTVQLAPHHYGQPLTNLHQAVDAVLATHHVVPLLATTAAREQAYAPTRVLAIEQAIADTVERLTTQPTSTHQTTHHAHHVQTAIAAKERALGGSLTPGQAAAVHAIASSPTRVAIVVGVAGSGKTTALDAATTALEQSGHRVLGAATSGQAAKTLGTEADIDSRTVASLLWRLDHGRLSLDRRSVVILDEAAMTTDDDLLRLLTAIEHTGARLVLVGDPVQLGAVGPGGAMAALIDRHPEIVTTLGDNIRQHDPAERAAVADLRAGRVADALDHYRTRDRIHVAPVLEDTVADMVGAWNRDRNAGLDTVMLAWRRDHVQLLNREARRLAVEDGRVTGPEIGVDGQRFAAGDPIILTAPLPAHGLHTSERLTVTAVDPDSRSVTAIPDGQRGGVVPLTLTGTDLETGKVRHAYATTVHRAQGQTVDTCHYLAAGGGHSLAYVALTRARHQTHIHAVADNPAQAIDDLHHHWTRQDTQTWAIDTQPTPGTTHPLAASEKVQRARAQAELDALTSLRTATPADDLADARNHWHRQQLSQDLADLRNGTGPQTNTPAGHAARQLNVTHRQLTAARHALASPTATRRDRRQARRQLPELEQSHTTAERAWRQRVQPVVDDLTRQMDALDTADHERTLDRLALDRLDRRITQLRRTLEPERQLQRTGPDLSIDL